MPVTTDDQPGVRVEEELQLEDRTSSGDPSVEGALRRVGNYLRVYLGAAVHQLLKVKNYPAGFDDINLSGVLDGQYIKYDGGSNSLIPGSPSGAGESNTASNVGAQIEVYKQKTGVDLEFRTIEEAGGLTIVQETDVIKISSGFRRHFLLMGG